MLRTASGTPEAVLTISVTLFQSIFEIYTPEAFWIIFAASGNNLILGFLGSSSSNEKFFGPTLAGNFLWITGTDGYLRKFDPSTGKEFSKHRIGNQILYRTYAVQDKLFIITRSGKIIAFD